MNCQEKTWPEAWKKAEPALQPIRAAKRG